MFDTNEDMFFDPEIESAEERLSFPAFFRKMFKFRTSDISPTFKPTPIDIQLPQGSIIHLLDNMYSRDNGLPLKDIPNLDIPLINNDPFRKVLIHMRKPVTDGPVSVGKDFVYRDINLDKNLRYFKTTLPNGYRVLNTIHDIPGSGNILPIINHNPIFRTFVRGAALLHYRQFKVIMGSVLNTAAQLHDGKMQYIILPLSRHVYPKDKFMQAANAETAASIKAPNSFHYFFMVHWLNFINREAKYSMFREYPKDNWHNTVFVLTAGGSKMPYTMFWTLEDLYNLSEKSSMYQRFINQFNAFVLAEMGAQLEESSDESTTDDAIEKAAQTAGALTEQKDSPTVQTPVTQETTDDVPLDNPEDPQDFEEDKTIEKLIKDLYTTLGGIDHSADVTATVKGNPLDYSGVKKTTQSRPTEEPDFIIPEEEGPTPIDEIQHSDSNAPYQTNEGQLTKLTPAMTEEKVEEIGKDFIRSIEEETDEYINAHPTLTPKQKERVRLISKKYKDVKLNGKSIEQHILGGVNPGVHSNTLDFLKDHLPDESMATSSIKNFDTIYMEKFFEKDLASIAVSLNKNGMFLTGIEEQTHSDELNRLRKFKFNYEDANGKKHTVKFDIPHIDENGCCFINGVRSYLRKQMTNLPICKVSPTRVSLASNYNKTVVERNEAKAHNFLAYIQRLINKINEHRTQIFVNFGDNKINDRYAYEYTSLARVYNEIRFSDPEGRNIELFFSPDTRFTKGLVKSGDTGITKLEEKFGILFGTVSTGNNTVIARLFINTNNIVTVANVEKGTNNATVTLVTTLIDMLTSIFDVRLSSRLDEWTDIKILDKKFPVGFLLCFQLGLRNTLDYLGVKYTKYPKRTRINIRESDIVIPFADQVIVIPRYPLRNSLIMAGLKMFDTKQYLLEDFDSKNIYYQLLLDKGYRTNYLKGIEDTFALFVDPITRDVLIQMNEPTTFKDLLIRATDMLTTDQHVEASAVANHRLRSYERINAVVYNEITRQFAAYHRRQGPGTAFSINPNAVLQRILQDQAMVGVENINPIHEIKTTTGFTYTGMGGRTAQSFVVNDRRYPQDGIGVISEATPDSGSVAITAIAPPDPIIANVRGLISNDVSTDELQPTQFLSTPALLMPGATQDDAKRANFISIQLSHQLPTKEGECMRIRTGYERVIAHRSSSVYSYAAQADGKVTEVDEITKMCKIQYKDGSTHTFQYGETYGECADMVATLKLELTVKKGDSFKRGDILCYNPEYFEKDPTSRQVDWKHGVMATVAIMDCSRTFEDSSSISKEFGEKLEIQPVQVRQINLIANTIIHDAKKVGDTVDVNDYLLIFEDAEAADITSISTNESTLDYIAKLNRKTPKARVAGTIVKIEAYYSSPVSEMHPTLGKLVKDAIKDVTGKHKFSQGSATSGEYPTSQPLPEGTKFKNVKFEKDTVVLRYFIREEITAGIGDKIVFDSSLKSVIGSIHDDTTTESGKVIDALFSGSSISNRIVCSPLITGTGEQVLECLEDEAVRLYFGK